MGRDVISDNQVLELDAPHHFRYATRSDAADGSSSWEVQAVAGGTLVRHSVTGDAKGLFASLGIGLLKRKVEQEFKSDMARLERRLNALA
jgi:carbon monoxide dehydrogenase subunit G